MKNVKNIAALIILIIVTTMINYSCQPEEAPNAVVIVIDENNEPVKDAQVFVRAFNYQDEATVIYLEDGSVQIQDVRYTDKDGKVFYDFKYEAIYKVEVYVEGNYHEPNRTGSGTLFLENDKTEEITIKVH